MATAFKQVKNNSKSTLASSITNSATSLTVTTGQGSRFPTSGNSFWATIWDKQTYQDARDDPNGEIVLVTASPGDTFTITRAQLGTTGVAHASGQAFEMLLVDQHFLDLYTAVNATEDGKQKSFVSLTTATAIGTAAKVATGTAPVAGDFVVLTLTSGNSAASPTLNVNSAGAIAIRIGNVAATAVSATVAAGGSMFLYYDGTTYQMLGSTRNSDSDTTYFAPTTYTTNTTTPVTAAVNQGYIANSASVIVYTTPATAAVGQIIEFIGLGAGGFRIGTPAGDGIYFEGVQATNGTTGYIQGGPNDYIALRCTVANTTWVNISNEGNIVTDTGYTGNSSMVFNETLAGTVNGSNTAFTTVYASSNIVLTKNGLVLKPGAGNDYTVSGRNITFSTAPASGAVLLATYSVSSTGAAILGTNSIIANAAPTGTINGTNAVFTTPQPYIGGTLEVYINGIRQKNGTHFTETTPASGTFTMSDAPLTGDDVIVSYQVTAAAAANADTVDNFHASATPSANTIPVLDANAKIPQTMVAPKIIQVSRTTDQTLGTSVAFTPTNVDVDTSGGTFSIVANRIVVGAGVSLIRFSYNMMGQSITGTYLYSRIRRNGTTEISQHICPITTTGGFASTWQTLYISVSSGDYFEVIMDGTGGSLRGSVSYMIAEVIA